MKIVNNSWKGVKNYLSKRLYRTVNFKEIEFFDIQIPNRLHDVYHKDFEKNGFN